jgi:hypothetical protein
MRILKPAIPGMVIYRPSFMANKSVKRLNTRRDMRPEPPLRQVYKLQGDRAVGARRLWYVPEFSSNGELRDEDASTPSCGNRRSASRQAGYTRSSTADPLDDAIVDNRSGGGQCSLLSCAN